MLRHTYKHIMHTKTYFYLLLEHIQYRKTNTVQCIKTERDEAASSKAHLSIIVQVRIESHSVVAGRLQVDEWRRVRIVDGKIHIKLETTVSIRCVSWTGHQYLTSNIAHKLLYM